MAPPSKNFARARRQGDFVGREASLLTLAELTESFQVVTITGVAGVGKTRLALEHAAQSELQTRFCDLTEASSLDGVLSAVSEALEVSLDTGRPAEQLGHAFDALGDVLIVLDNFEQVAMHAPDTVGIWTHLAKDARFVVTSQERLRIDGEATLELAPLGLPSDDADPAPAVQLFLRLCEAAGAARPGELDDQRAIIAELVRQLDGLPLALQLASAQMRVLSPAQLLERMSDRFALLEGTSRSAPKRHRTLRASIDWSWELLNPDERSALAQCSLFRGGFTIEAAEGVVALPSAQPVFAVIRSLRDKSLLFTERRDDSGALRYALYSSIREYASERLTTLGLAEAWARHSAFFVRVAEAWAEGVSVFGGSARLAQLNAERDNLLEVVFRAESSEDPAVIGLAARAALALEPVLWGRGTNLRFMTVLGRLLKTSSEISFEGRSLRAPLHLLRGRLYRVRGEPKECRASLDAALKVAEGDAERAAIYLELGNLERFDSDLDAAKARYADALNFCKEENRPLFGNILAQLGGLHCERGALPEAEAHLGRALEIHREIGNRRAEGVALTNLGVIHQELGRTEEARAYLSEAIEIHREVGFKRFEGLALADLGASYFEAHRLDEAHRNYAAALVLIKETGDKRYAMLNQSALAAVLVAKGRLEEARRLRQLVASGRTSPADPEDRVLLDAVSLYEGHAELAEARRTLSEGDEARAATLCERARARLSVRGKGVPPDEVRLAARLLERQLEPLEGHKKRLVVSEDGSWFCPPGGERVDLKSRPKLAGILAGLVARFESGLGSASGSGPRTSDLSRPGQDGHGCALSVEAIAEVGWPGERILPQAARNRVRVAVATLRKAGLGKYIETTPEGWGLAPETPLLVLRVSAPEGR